MQINFVFWNILIEIELGRFVFSTLLNIFHLDGMIVGRLNKEILLQT